MSDLSENYPWHHAFLKWFNQRLSIYAGQPVQAELYTKAMEWVTKDIRGVDG